MRPSPSLTTSSVPSKGLAFEAINFSTEKDLRADINKYLHNDRQAIVGARRAALSSPKFALLTSEQQEKSKEKHALDRIAQRKDGNRHVISRYPEFANYLPPAIYGKVSESDLKKKKCIERQVEAWWRAHSTLHGRARYNQDDDDDDEEPIPRFKKQEDSDDPRLGDIAQYVAQRADNRSSHLKHTGDSGEEEVNEDQYTDEEDDSEDQDSGEESSEDEATHQGSQYGHRRQFQQNVRAAKLGASKDFNRRSNEQNSNARRRTITQTNDEDSSPEPMMAIIRGQPLPNSETLASLNPTPYIANLRRQRFITGIERAVIRGQVFDTEDEDESNRETIRVPSKRRSDVREGLGERNAKKAKVGK